MPQKKIVRSFRNGAIATGAAGSFSFFASSKFNEALVLGNIGAAVIAFYSILSGDSEGSVSNIASSLATNYLAIFFHYGLGIPSGQAFLLSGFVLASLAEVYAQSLNTELPRLQ